MLDLRHRVCGEARHIVGPRQTFALPWRDPEELRPTGRSHAVRHPRYPEVGRSGVAVGLPLPFVERNALSKLRDDRGRVLRENAFVAADRFEPLQPEEHRDAGIRTIERAQHERLAFVAERGIRDDPVGARHDWEGSVGEEVDRSFAVAVVVDVARNDREAMLDENLGDMPLAARWLPDVTDLADAQSGHDVLQKRPRRPGRRWEVVEAVGWLAARRHDRTVASRKQSAIDDLFVLLLFG